MAHFTYAAGGYINLDHVAFIRPAEDDGTPAVAVLTDGKRFELELPDDGAEEFNAVIPAAPGMVATVISVVGAWDDAAHMSVRPESVEADTSVRLEPIIGWRNMGDYRAPVFIADLGSGDHAFLRLDDGWQELERWGERYLSLKLAREAALEQDQAIWDKVTKRLERMAADTLMNGT